MKRTSKLGVLVRLARMNEAKCLREFAAARRVLQRLDEQRGHTEHELYESGHSSWFETHPKASVDEIRDVDRRQTYLASRFVQLTEQRRPASEEMQRALLNVARAKLRTRAMEKAEADRRNALRNQQDKRRERELEDLSRRIRSGRPR